MRIYGVGLLLSVFLVAPASLVGLYVGIAAILERLGLGSVSLCRAQAFALSVYGVNTCKKRHAQLRGFLACLCERCVGKRIEDLAAMLGGHAVAVAKDPSATASVTNVEVAAVAIVVATCRYLVPVASNKVVGVLGDVTFRPYVRPYKIRRSITILNVPKRTPWSYESLYTRLLV